MKPTVQGKARRQLILEALRANGGAAASSSALAAYTELPRPTVQYHLKVLRRAGRVVVDDTENHASHIEHFYREAGR